MEGSMEAFQWGRKSSPVFADAFALRELVFVQEQGFKDEWDELDDIAWHVVLYDGAEPIAAGRYVEMDGGIAKLGRVCVKKDLRGNGAGRKIMGEMERHAAIGGATKLVLGAQCEAQAFYASLGYSPLGEVYMDEHCEHIHMEKKAVHPGFSRIAILGAMDSETQLLIRQMDSPMAHKIAGITFHAGKLAGKDVVVATCGIGKVSAACTTQMAIDLFGADCVINTGVAGGLSPELKPCDVVVSENVTYHDLGVVDDATVPLSHKANPLLVDLAQRACRQVKRERFCYMSGRIASGDQFINDPKRKKKIVEDYNPLCVEMEGAAIGHCCTLNQVPFVVIRAISDSADGDAEMSFSQFKEIASNTAAAIVVDMLANLT